MVVAPQRGEILIAGAGIAGLTAALAFAKHGYPVRVLEQAESFEGIGAGLQLSPNATRLLDRLGVLARLDTALAPEGVALLDGRTLGLLSRIPLGIFAAQRWGAPYLALRRSDLHAALAEQAKLHAAIRIDRGARIVALETEGPRPALLCEDGTRCPADLVVGADGVGSAVRSSVSGVRFTETGTIAWRAVVPSQVAVSRLPLLARGEIAALLLPGVHLIAYPVDRRADQTVNLVAFSRGNQHIRDDAALRGAFGHAAPQLRELIEDAARWTPWPLRTVDPEAAWTHPSGVALIGDAAHAMTPYAAQGAAMAIEDAAALACFSASSPDDRAGALRRFQQARKARVKRVAARGALNRLAWHAAGPVALVRNMLLRLRPAERLAADLDWLYGFDAEAGIA